MNGKHVERLVYDWLQAHYPDGANWMDPEFDAFADVPWEIQMIAAFDALEYNIGNGGWSQVLWNCHGRWRELIAIARKGYTTIGATDQAAALTRLEALCERDEAECRSAILSSAGSKNAFSNFTRRSYGANGEDWERLFWPSSDAGRKRLEWLEANEERVRDAVGATRRRGWFRWPWSRSS